MPKLKILSTAFSSSLLAKNTTRSFFSKIKLDLGIITLSFRIIAPILISSGKFESRIFLLTNSSIKHPDDLIKRLESLKKNHHLKRFLTIIKKE